jgi:competence protein ComEC
MPPPGHPRSPRSRYQPQPSAVTVPGRHGPDRRRVGSEGNGGAEQGERAAVHAAAASPLGASNPRQEGPADLRLVAPALAVWGVAAAASRAGAAWALRGAVVAALTAAVVVAVVAAATGFGRGRRGTGLAPAVVAVLLCAAAAATVTGLRVAEAQRGPLHASAQARGTTDVVVRVTSDPRESAPRTRGAVRAPRTVVLEGVAERVGDTRVRTPVVVFADGAVRRWLRLLPSTEIRVRARLAPPDVLRVHGPPRVLAPPGTAQRIAGDLRAGLRRAAAPLPADARALLPGLVVGDTSGLTPELRQAFRTTDLAHLTAVSGANLTIVLMLLIGPPGTAIRAERRGLAAALGLPLRRTALLGAALTAGFVLVCRPGPSVLRAAACGLITLLAVGTGRRRSLLPALATAVIALVLYRPGLATSYGFALSVLATGSLLTLAPRWSAALRARGVPPRLAEALAAAGAAQAVCGPVIVLLSGHLSLVAIPCNLLAEPAVGPATVLGFAALATGPFAPPAARVLARVAGLPTQWIAAVARHGAALPGAELAWPGGRSGAVLLAAVTVAAAVCAGPLLTGRRARTACALLLVLAVLRPLPRLPPVLPGLPAAWPPAGWRFAMCDVGQGDALALAAGPGTAVVIDTGPDPALVDACLRDLGVTAIPLLVLTHFHADHVDGLPGVLRHRAVGAIETTVLDEPATQAAEVRREAAAARVPVIRAAAGERRRLGPLDWRVLWPPPTPTALPDDGPNDASVALLVRTGGLTLLLMGDLEPPAQQELLATVPDLPRVDVLKVAHHGSAHQDPALLARLRPRLALVSVGTGNLYGHPAARTLGTLRTLGAAVLRTDTDGPVAVTGDSPAALRAALRRRRGRRPG